MKRVPVIVVLLTLATTLVAQTTPTPQRGQPGKDVIWLPSPDVLVERMLDMGKVTSSDVVMDLGSGDGRLVIAAAKRGAQAIGIEYDAGLVEVSKKNAAAVGVANRTSFVKADLFETDLSKATVITLFLREDLNLKLRPKLLTLRPGTRVVSNTFSMGEWEPDDFVQLERDCAAWCTAMMWTIPARVQGAWRLAERELTLQQTFQFVTGTLGTTRSLVAVTDGRLRGDEIAFISGGSRYTGRVVTGTRMEGTVTTRGATTKWTATRGS